MYPVQNTMSLTITDESKRRKGKRNGRKVTRDAIEEVPGGPESVPTARSAETQVGPPRWLFEFDADGAFSISIHIAGFRYKISPIPKIAARRPGMDIRKTLLCLGGVIFPGRHFSKRFPP